MKIKLAAAAGTLMLAALTIPTASNAASFSSTAQPLQNHLSQQSSPVELAQYWRRDRWRGGYGGRCRGWRHECADRWGWGSWRFQRCLARRGC